jgi:hypothetical protein
MEPWRLRAIDSHNGGLEAKKRRRRGSVDQWSQMRIALSVEQDLDLDPH